MKSMCNLLKVKRRYKLLNASNSITFCRFMLTEGLKQCKFIEHASNKSCVGCIYSASTQYKISSPPPSTVFPHLTLSDPITLLRTARYPVLVHVKYANCLFRHWPLYISAPVVGRNNLLFCVHISTCRRDPYLEAEGNRFVQRAAFVLNTYMVSNRRGRPCLMPVWTNF